MAEPRQLAARPPEEWRAGECPKLFLHGNNDASYTGLESRIQYNYDKKRKDTDYEKNKTKPKKEKKKRNVEVRTLVLTHKVI